MSLCESSQEVKMIIKELNVYTTSTKLEHNTQIMSMKKSASKLKWNNLNNLVYQVSNKMILVLFVRIYNFTYIKFNTKQSVYYIEI